MITTTSRLLLQLLHERGIALRSSFLFLSACSVVHLLRTFFLLPRKLIPYPLPDNYTYGYESTADVTDESALQIQSVILEKWQRTIRRGGMHSFNRWECWIESTWMQKKVWLGESEVLCSPFLLELYARTSQFTFTIALMCLESAKCTLQRGC